MIKYDFLPPTYFYELITIATVITIYTMYIIYATYKCVTMGITIYAYTNANVYAHTYIR